MIRKEKGENNYYQTLMGDVTTANQDGTIPLSSRVVASYDATMYTGDLEKMICRANSEPALLKSLKRSTQLLKSFLEIGTHDHRKVSAQVKANMAAIAKTKATVVLR